MRKDRSAYYRTYQKDRYEQITVKLYKGDKQRLELLASEYQTTVVGLFVDAMKAQYGIAIRGADKV